MVAEGLDLAPELFDLTLTQGHERLHIPNIPFRRVASYPANWWHSPTFQIGGGSAEAPREAWVDGVRVGEVAGR